MNCSIAQSLALCSRTRCFRVCFTIRCGPRQPRTAARAIPISWAVSTLSRLYSTRKHTKRCCRVCFTTLCGPTSHALPCALQPHGLSTITHAHTRVHAFIFAHTQTHTEVLSCSLCGPQAATHWHFHIFIVYDDLY